ncbi:hypothetical protein O999_25225 [Pseudomonas putida LF54]|nr:hypothetical protein O999_25225 [Pseudomonas putida LF54]
MIRIFFDQVPELTTNGLDAGCASATLVADITVPIDAANTSVLASMFQLDPHIACCSIRYNAALQVLRYAVWQLIVRSQETLITAVGRAEVGALQELQGREAAVAFEDYEVAFFVRHNELQLGGVKTVLNDVLGQAENFLRFLRVRQHQLECLKLALSNVIAEAYVLLVELDLVQRDNSDIPHHYVNCHVSYRIRNPMLAG